jgi:hypothetical protein
MSAVRPPWDDGKKSAGVSFFPTTWEVGSVSRSDAGVDGIRVTRGWPHAVCGVTPPSHRFALIPLPTMWGGKQVPAFLPHSSSPLDVRRRLNPRWVPGSRPPDRSWTFAPQLAWAPRI